MSYFLLFFCATYIVIFVRSIVFLANPEARSIRYNTTRSNTTPSALKSEIKLINNMKNAARSTCGYLWMMFANIGEQLMDESSDKLARSVDPGN